MEFSTSIAKLALALSKVQSQITGAKKDSTNPFFNSKYADLESVWEAIKQPLTENELAISQGFREDEKAIIIESLLMHSSGEWIKSSLKMPIIKQDPQSIGSLASYGRRYSLAALIGVYQSDDDANTAMPSKKTEQQILADEFF
jgi:hypothetical protein